MATVSMMLNCARSSRELVNYPEDRLRDDAPIDEVATLMRIGALHLKIAALVEEFEEIQIRKMEVADPDFDCVFDELLDVKAQEFKELYRERERLIAALTMSKTAGM